MTSPEQRGAAYGLRQSLDSIGSFTGPLLAVVLMLLTGDQFRLVFWIAFLPGLLAVLILFLVVKEAHPKTGKATKIPLRFQNLFLYNQGVNLIEEFLVLSLDS